jgi:alkylation response protein AidB-like acyl-CoA dehydrogenase
LNFAMTPEQEELKTTTRRFLSQRLPTNQTRAIMETEHPIALDVWATMASELGVAGVLVPESAGGLGLGFVEAACILQEIGRIVAPLPFLVTSVLAVELLSFGDPTAPATASTLEGIATGAVVVGLMGRSAEDPLAPCGTLTSNKVDAGSRFVLDGAQATHLLVAIESDEGPMLALVSATSPGVHITAQTTLDLTRPIAEATLSAADATIVLDPSAFQRARSSFATMASAAIAQDMIGGAERVLEMSVDYAKDRHQFGRPIGSFQAIKHRLADMLVDVESARSTALYAAFTIADGADDQAIAAATAKSVCGDAYFRVASAAIQVHGGIGFTWEHDAHLYFKRAKADQILFGNGPLHRRRLAGLLGLT